MASLLRITDRLEWWSDTEYRRSAAGANGALLSCIAYGEHDAVTVRSAADTAGSQFITGHLRPDKVDRRTRRTPRRFNGSGQAGLSWLQPFFLPHGSSRSPVAYCSCKVL